MCSSCGQRPAVSDGFCGICLTNAEAEAGDKNDHDIWTPRTRR